MSQQDERKHDGQRCVLYVYRCQACHHRSEVRLPDDRHDGESAACSTCGGPVLRWAGHPGMGWGRHISGQGRVISHRAATERPEFRLRKQFIHDKTTERSSDARHAQRHPHS